jgi:alkaline phosphatase
VNSKIFDFKNLSNFWIGSLSRELLMFDSMVAYVLDFAEKNKDTLVVITSDHECGGKKEKGKEQLVITTSRRKREEA